MSWPRLRPVTLHEGLLARRVIPCDAVLGTPQSGRGVSVGWCVDPTRTCVSHTRAEGVIATAEIRGGNDAQCQPGSGRNRGGVRSPGANAVQNLGCELS